MTTNHMPSVLNAFGTDADDSLSWLTHAAVDSLAHVDYASVSVTSADGDIATVGATDPLALKADWLQSEFGEGPSFDAAYGTAVAHSDDVTEDAQWPRYGAQVAELGIRAQTAVPIRVGYRTLGSLNLYSTSTGPMSDLDLSRAQRFGAQAATAMLLSRRVETLTDALHSHGVIGQAIGLVRTRFKLDQQRAFQYLVKVSQTSNVRLRDVAHELVGQANQPIT